MRSVASSTSVVELTYKMTQARIDRTITRDALLTPRTLRNFLGQDEAGESTGRKSSTLSSKNYNQLARVWLSPTTPQLLSGVLLGRVGGDDASPQEILGEVLQGGMRYAPQQLAVDGSYFLYHGSYLYEARYVVRRVIVETESDSSISVREIVFDRMTGKVERREAVGVMIFAGELPQIVLHAMDDKRGIASILGNQIQSQRGEMEWSFGSLQAKPRVGAVAYRPSLMVREKALGAAKMAEETGVWSLAELRESSRAQHWEAFAHLKGLIRLAESIDPMSAFPGAD